MTEINASCNAGMQELRQAILRWGLLEDGLPFQTPTSVLQRVRTPNGAWAFLKIALCEEERRGAALLRWWSGEGAVRVLELHGNAVLLECACGSRSLTRMAQTGEDDEAIRIICAVAARLHNRGATDMPERLPQLPHLEHFTPEMRYQGCESSLAPRSHKCNFARSSGGVSVPLHLKCVPFQMLSALVIPLAQCFPSLALAASTQGGIFQELSAIADSLLATPQQVVLLHGDLHHENVLDAGVRGWLCIDPKGYLGERGFDYANIFCNPDYSTATQPERFENRVTVVAETAQLERQRLLSWIAAWAGLSAAWHLEDGGNADTALTVAALALCALHT